jgi:hypothetical protein
MHNFVYYNYVFYVTHIRDFASAQFLNRQVTVQGDWVLYEKHLKDACNPLLALGLCTDECLKNTWAEFGLEPPEPFNILPRIPFLRLGTDFDGHAEYGASCAPHAISTCIRI